MDIDSPSSDESSQSDTSFSSTEESLDDSYEENEKDEGDTNNNEDVEAVPKSSTSSHVHEKSSDNNEGIETTNKDKELSWNDTKLFPPDKSRSNVWKFGGFIKDDKGKLVKEKVVCSLCGKKIPWSGSPTNFKTHLMDKHGSTVKPVFDEVPGAGKNQPKITLFSQSYKIKKYKNDHPKQKKFRKFVRNWTIRDKRPLNICQDKGFRDIIDLADNQLCVPSRSTVTRDIRKLYLEKKKETREKFKEVKYFSCTNDAGTSLGGHSFVDVNVHYLTEDFDMEKKVVAVNAIKSKKAKDYRKTVDSVLEDHSIKEKVFSFTTDNEPTMLSTFSRKERNGCFAHIESKATQKATESTETLKKIRKKFRKIAGKSKKSSKFLRQIAQEQRNRGLKERTIKQEIKTRFTSTHTMIRSFLNDPNENSDEAIDTLKVKMNVDAINAALEACTSQKVFEELEITDADVKVAENITPLLDVLEEGVSLVGGEKYCSGAVTLPFLARFLGLLNEDEADPTYIKTFKEVLKEEMITRCQDNLNFLMLAKCSVFDKRFSRLTFLDKLAKYDVTSISKETVLNQIKKELEVIEISVSKGDNVSKSQNDEPPTKKMKFLADIDEEEVIEQVSVLEEFEKYLKESAIKADECPRKWWKQRKEIYPNVAELARKYLSVQGSSTPAERVMSDMGTILNKKRLSLGDELFSEMMYLGDCV